MKKGLPKKKGFPRRKDFPKKKGFREEGLSPRQEENKRYAEKIKK